MLSSTSQYSLAFHSFFNKENTSAETKTKHDFSSSISDDYNILKLGENNSQSLWCTKVFQVINATKALASVLGTKGMNIKSCYFPKDRSHITINQELQHLKKSQNVCYS